MKKLMIMVSAIIMAATTQAKQVETNSFEEVRVNVPARVRIISGDTYSVNVTASDEQMVQAIQCHVEKGVLKIQTRDLEALNDKSESLRITIITPTMPRLSSGREMQMMPVRVKSER